MVRTAGALWATDEQNRLTAMTMKSGLPTEMIRKRLEPDEFLQDSAGYQRTPCRMTGDRPLWAETDEAASRLNEPVVQFTYDYLGRRVEKIVKNNWTGTSGTTATHPKYVYDGDNLIAELDGSVNSKPVLSTYVWGLDLSGTTWGAGGVGGLLMVKDGTKTYFPAYDGNGNVSALLDSADGSLDAKYEYGAFGEPLRVGGAAIAEDNPFRFSTKYTDVESALVYYGFRYYSPSLGRFLNRDPIEELGGSNLYAFVENDPVNGWDYLGLNDELICTPEEYMEGLCDNEYRLNWRVDRLRREAEASRARALELAVDYELLRMEGCFGGDCEVPPQQRPQDQAPQDGGASILEPGIDPEEKEEGGFFSGLADIGQGLIGIAGLVPVVGNAADVLNATISAGRGNYVDASLDGFSALPGGGQVVGAVNVSRKVSRGAKGIWNSVKKLVKKDAPKTGDWV